MFIKKNLHFENLLFIVSSIFVILTSNVWNWQCDKNGFCISAWSLSGSNYTSLRKLLHSMKDVTVNNDAL